MNRNLFSASPTPRIFSENKRNHLIIFFVLFQLPKKSIEGRNAHNERSKENNDVTGSNNHFAPRIFSILFLTCCPFIVPPCWLKNLLGKTSGLVSLTNIDKINYINKLLWQDWRMLAEESQRGKEGEDPFQNHIIIQAFCTRSPKVGISREWRTSHQQGNKNNIHLSQLRLCWKRSQKCWHCWEM